MKKIFGLIFAILLFVLVVGQVQQVLAENGDKPITSPLTSPECKPGFGFGDKNHCHSGPPGQNKVENGNDNQNNNGHKNK